MPLAPPVTIAILPLRDMFDGVPVAVKGYLNSGYVIVNRVSRVRQ